MFKVNFRLGKSIKNKLQEFKILIFKHYIFILETKKNKAKNDNIIIFLHNLQLFKYKRAKQKKYRIEQTVYRNKKIELEISSFFFFCVK